MHLLYCCWWTIILIIIVMDYLLIVSRFGLKASAKCLDCKRFLSSQHPASAPEPGHGEVFRGLGVSDRGSLQNRAMEMCAWACRSGPRSRTGPWRCVPGTSTTLLIYFAFDLFPCVGIVILLLMYWPIILFIIVMLYLLIVSHFGLKASVKCLNCKL